MIVTLSGGIAINHLENMSDTYDNVEKGCICFLNAGYLKADT